MNNEPSNPTRRPAECCNTCVLCEQRPMSKLPGFDQPYCLAFEMNTSNMAVCDDYKGKPDG